MKRSILALGFATLLLPAPAFAQYPYPGGDGAEQMVQDWYRRFLGRAADPQASAWIEAIRQGQAPEAVLAQIVGSSEYYMRAGGTPDRFVRRLYLDLTGRPPSPRETQFWLNSLYQSDRQDVAYQMLQRYPQGWGGGAYQPGIYSTTPEYDYRRPYYRYYPR